MSNAKQNDKKERIKQEKQGFIDYNSIFATTLRGLLNDRKITQDALADECGVSRQAVSQWKDGKTLPDAFYLLKISIFFDVSTDYLLGLSATPTKDKDLAFVSDYTGLSSNSIKLLNQLKSIDKDKELSMFLESEAGKTFLFSVVKFCDDVKESAKFRGHMAATADEPFLCEVLDNVYISEVQSYEVLAYRVSQFLQRYFDERSKQILQPVLDYEIQRNNELVQIDKELKQWFNEIIDLYMEDDNNGNDN